MKPRFALTMLACLATLACDSPADPDAGADAGFDAGSPADAGPAAPCGENGECNDGLFCNGEEQCVFGRCAEGVPPLCDDEVGCTADSCSEERRACVHTPPDADGDGVPDAACRGLDGLPLGRDCDDADANRFPDNPEVCDAEHHDEDCDASTLGGVDEDSDGQVADRCCNTDGAGALRCGTDCDDARPNTREGAPELCDDADNDCDDIVDEELTTLSFGRDCDRDGFGEAPTPEIRDCALPSEPVGCAGGIWVPNVGDCDDTLGGRNPGLVEVCDGVDNDCDGPFDEGLTFLDFYPDCDGDGDGDGAATPRNACMVPPAPACVGGAWTTRGGDCDDDDATRFSTNPERCNGLDDDCDGLTDDIIDGVVVCELGETRTCVTACGPTGTQTCEGTCLGWSRCTAPEQCNSCDDDGDGARDEDFECERGTSQACTVETCGTDGTQFCVNDCTWNACEAATEVCNYCDDDADGHFDEEEPMSALDRVDGIDCDLGDVFGSASCFAVNSGSDIELGTTLLDGSSNDQAGALWFSPADWHSGWGPIELDVTLEAYTVPSGGSFESALGGWSLVIARDGGAVGVGAPQDTGIPRDIEGIASSWYWTTFDSCYFPNRPPSASDSMRFVGISQGGILPRARGTMNNDSTCFSGETFVGSADLNSQTTAVTQRMRMRYTPDDPRTASVDEEEVALTVGNTTSLYFGSASGPPPRPNNDLPVGSGPLRIGLTAGTFTASGFEGPPPGSVWGVPVVARVHLRTVTPPTGPGTQSSSVLEDLRLSRERVCY